MSSNDDQAPSRPSRRRRRQADPPTHVIRHDYDDQDEEEEEEWYSDDNLDVEEQPKQRATTKPLSNNTAAAVGPEYKDQVRSVAVAQRIPIVQAENESPVAQPLQPTIVAPATARTERPLTVQGRTAVVEDVATRQGGNASRRTQTQTPPKIESRSILQSFWDAEPSDQDVCLLYGSIGLLVVVAIVLLALLAAGVIF
jgi:hypothetical protein